MREFFRQSPETGDVVAVRRRIAACVAAALALGGCSADSAPYKTPKPSPVPASTTEPSHIENDEQPNVHELLKDQAGIQLIYVPVENAAPDARESSRSTPDVKAAKAIVRDMITRKDRSFLEEGQQAFDHATYGRYQPKTVEASAVSAISLPNGCLDDSSEKIAQINDAVKAVKKTAQTIPITVVDAPSCQGGDNRETIAGLAGSGQPPILTNDSLRLHGDRFAFWRIAIHETGHFGGLSHAGTAKCDHIAEGTDCNVDPTADSRSVMGYSEHEATPNEGKLHERFSIPELYKLELLDETEAMYITPDSLSTLGQKATLHAMQTSTDSTKLLILDDGKPGEQSSVEGPIYISWGDDPSPPYDEKCIPGQSLPDGVTANDVTLIGSKTIDGQRNDFVCFKTLSTGDRSVQVRGLANRDRGNDQSLALIARDQTQNLVDGLKMNRPKGATVPGTVYSGEGVEVSLPEYHDQSSITLRVSPE
ncbi:hypothetical protein CR983_03255 [Candidatus Saccharibacteria bacterium]|nr:MAG: hypothetical protein CR983_03255 [Candidatus Saccharibacteria bacterium]